MNKPPSLSVDIQHQLGSFRLNAKFTLDRWPAVLFGPSGAGKSTLLRILAGLEKADAAYIRLDDLPLRNGKVHARDGLQYVTQLAALFPHLTAARNVAFGLRGMSAGERESRVHQILRLVGAEALASRLPADLSGGEQKRVAIARALAPNPRLLLLDEAFSGLDAGARQSILAEFHQLFAERGVAALYVTHEVVDAFALDGEVIVLDDGKVVGQGPVQQILALERDRILALLTPSRERPAPPPGAPRIS